MHSLFSKCKMIQIIPTGKVFREAGAISSTARSQLW